MWSRMCVCVADVGGFVQDPDPELLVRWYQAGALQPFFRGHSAKVTKRREPWLFGVEVTSAIRSAVQDRYCLLPYWYTLFHQAHVSALPPIRYCILNCSTTLFTMAYLYAELLIQCVFPYRPLWVEFPIDSSTFAVENQYMIGKHE